MTILSTGDNPTISNTRDNRAILSPGDDHAMLSSTGDEIRAILRTGDNRTTILLVTSDNRPYWWQVAIYNNKGHLEKLSTMARLSTVAELSTIAKLSMMVQLSRSHGLPTSARICHASFQLICHE